MPPTDHSTVLYGRVFLELRRGGLIVIAVLLLRPQNGSSNPKNQSKVDRTRIQPVGGKHAIEVMAIGVEWVAPPLGDSQLLALQAVYEASPGIKEFLPKLAPMQALVIQGSQFGVTGTDGNVQLQPQNVAMPQFVTRNGGFDLQRFDVEGNVVWVAAIRPEFISISCSAGAYDRWQNVKPRALSLLAPFLDAAIAQGAKVNAIGLQYQDAFRLVDGASPATSSELFRQDGQYLPRHTLEQPSLWHCHQGWFSSSPGGRHVLNNVATEVADVGGTHFARIGGQHRLFATAVDGSRPMPIEAHHVDEAVQFLHDENIKVINGILSDGALEAIGCTVGGT